MNGCYGPFYSFHYFPFSPYVCGEYVCCIFIAECVHSFITSSQYAITLPFFALIISVCVCVFFLLFHFVTSLVSHSFLFFFIACLFSADELHMCSTRARTNKHLHCCAGINVVRSNKCISGNRINLGEMYETRTSPILAKYTRRETPILIQQCERHERK